MVSFVKGCDEDFVSDVMKDEGFRDKFVDSVSKVLDNELLCSKSHSSILRSTDPRDIASLDTVKLEEELKKCPYFYRLLQMLCYSKNTRYKGCDNKLKLLSPAIVLLKARCKEMSAWAAKNAIALQFGGCSNIVSAL